MKIIALAYPVFIAMDMVWIGIVMNSTYQKYLGPILRMRNNVFSPHIGSALLAWACIVVGAYLFVLPKIQNASIFAQFAWGAAYGLILYGVYDFTNHAILSSYPFTIALIDLLWGAVVNGVLAIVLVFLHRLFTR
jgi:uncharacterized membrane protein